MLHLCGQVQFFSRKQLVHDEHLHVLIQKKMATYLFFTIALCVNMTTTFDLWMLRLSYDISILVINFINLSWAPCHISVALFEALDISSVTFLKQMKVLLVEFNLTNKYVKDEGVNLNSLTIALTSIVSCELLHLFQPFVSYCFGHALSKAC